MTARYLVADWLPIKGLAQQIPGARVEEANHRVTCPGGGSILMLSGDNVDSGRGLGLDGVVIDEASLIDPQLWYETIRAALLDRIGWGLFLFTPKGLNWMHDLELDAERLPNWKTFHFGSRDNPFLSPDELDEMTAEMSSVVKRQEIDAEYVTGGAGMFERAWIQYWWPSEDNGKHYYNLGENERVPTEDCRRFSTADLAWSLEERADYTVISTWAVTPRRHLILLDVVRDHIEGPDMVRRFRGVYERLRPGYIAVERATRQLSISQDLQRAGLPLKEVRADKDKAARALPATARMEQRTVWFPRPAVMPVITECESELIAFPKGQHDDFVDTLAYACLQIAGPEPMVAFA